MAAYLSKRDSPLEGDIRILYILSKVLRKREREGGRKRIPENFQCQNLLKHAIFDSLRISRYKYYFTTNIQLISQHIDGNLINVFWIDSTTV